MLLKKIPEVTPSYLTAIHKNRSQAPVDMGAGLSRTQTAIVAGVYRVFLTIVQAAVRYIGPGVHYQEYTTLLFLYRADAAMITTELRQQTAARRSLGGL